MIFKFQFGLKSLLCKGLSEPDFYGDLVYKLKKIVGSHYFSVQFIYKKIGYNIDVLQQPACLVVNLITVGNFALNSSLIARWWVGLQTLWQFRLKDLSIDDMIGAWCFGCCQAHQGLPVGFLLLPYSVLCTVESLSLLYLVFIAWFICSRRWCMDKLRVFHANQTSMCLDPHLNQRVRLARRDTGLSPPVKYFYWPFQGGTSFVDHLCYLCLVLFMPWVSKEI